MITPAPSHDPRRFRFRPRMRALALITIGLAAAVGVVGALDGLPGLTVLGAVVVALGLAYLASPAWRLVVTIDDDGLEVGTPGRRRFRLAWDEIVRVVASPTTTTCFVDGGAPERSLLVPGDGAPASYDVEDKAALFAAIVARVPADRIQTVARLDATAP
ncbi:MAG: hypothetical protein IPL61_10550 [Myxococcales bacterium]|nr:hypothetical protein [Myxococcales bacterium]